MQRQCGCCGEECDEKDMTPGDVCDACDRKDKFAKFARECGLAMFPDPSGERYLFRVGGQIACKKGECVEFMDELWNALALAKGRKDLLIGGTS